MSSHDEGDGEAPQGRALTPEQREELDRRVQDHRKNPRPYLTWADVRAELECLGRKDPDPR